MKNEHQLITYFYVPSARVDECVSHLKDMARGLKEVRALEEWSITPKVLDVVASAKPMTMVKHNASFLGGHPSTGCQLT